MTYRKHKMIVNSEKLEINKPSELCQILFFDENKKGLTASVSAMEIDLINYILYESRKNILLHNAIFNPKHGFELVLDLKDISETLGKYSSSNFESIIKCLRTLRNKEVKINALGKNKDLVKTYTSFILKLQTITKKFEKQQKVSVLVDGEIVDMVLNVKKFFSKMHLTIQFTLQLKQSKLLYELLKDYESIKSKVIDYDLVLGLLNSFSERNQKFAYFNNDILKKVVAEINEKSDIIVSYEPIKEKPEGERLQVTKIKFNIEKQPESRLQELGLIQPSTSSLPFYNKSKTKLDTLVKNGYNVVDEEMWIQTDIKKNQEKYEAENRIDTWMKETPQQTQNEIYQLLASSIDGCDELSVAIKDYRLVGLFSQEIFTRNASETIDKLNEVIDEITEAE